MEMISSIIKNTIWPIWGLLASFLTLLLFLNQTQKEFNLTTPLGEFRFSFVSSTIKNLEPPTPLSNSISHTNSKNETINLVKQQPTNQTKRRCNILEGTWVYRPEQGPRYDSTWCPFINKRVVCRVNGRQNSEYEKWTWEATDCDIPLMNGTDMLEKLRNKRMVIVGDSLSRNQWDSLACLLYSSVPPSRAEIESRGGGKSMKFISKDYNCSVEFCWSSFLVELNQKHQSGRKVLVLDKISSESGKWIGADIMVFNSDHWWTHPVNIRAWEVFEYKGQLIEEMPVELAFERGTKTWASWIENNVDPTTTEVYYRSMSPVHYEPYSCADANKPLTELFENRRSPKFFVDVVKKAIGGISKSNVKYFDITNLSMYRVDAHPSIYYNLQWKDDKSHAGAGDCSHWCLPGLPDTWNRLLYASLFFEDLIDKSIF